MRLSWSIITLFCAAIIFGIPLFRAGAWALPPEPRRAALVNGALITGEAFDNELSRVERLSLRVKKSPSEVSRKQVLENLENGAPPDPCTSRFLRRDGGGIGVCLPTSIFQVSSS